MARFALLRLLIAAVGPAAAAATAAERRTTASDCRSDLRRRHGFRYWTSKPQGAVLIALPVWTMQHSADGVRRCDSDLLGRA